MRVASLGSVTGVPFIGHTATAEALGEGLAVAGDDALGDGDTTVAGLRVSAMAAMMAATMITRPTAASAPKRVRRNCMGDQS